FLATRRILNGAVDHRGLVLAPRVVVPRYLRPARLVVLHPGVKTRMLRARPGHQRQEPPLVLGDQSHVALIAELAVRYLEEVGTPHDLAEGAPGLAVDLAVGGVAVVNLAVD